MEKRSKMEGMEIMGNDIERKETELTGIVGLEKIEILSNYVDKIKWNTYREKYQNASKLNIVTDYPLQIDFELNSTCNLKCPMCPLSVEINSEKNKNLFPFELYKKIIVDGVKQGLSAIKLNYLNEPLLRSDLEEFISYAKENGILDIYLSTNGLLLSEKRIHSLIESGLSRIQISIDAYSEDIYDQIRPGGDYKKVVANVLNFIKIKKSLNLELPIVRVNFVKTELNEHQLDDFILFWRDKVDMLGIQEMIKPPKSSKELHSKKTEEKQNFQCSFPYKQLVITAEGNVLPCCTFYGEEMPLGNIFENEEILTFWNSRKMKELRTLHKNHNYRANPICKKCIEGSLLTDE